ncbi:MAG TPA: hypothetical protein VLH77_00260, partial [Gammaproteobacteria bacterium]|nr:hypothetical protein [Gammaproteobacteria bacterium]
MPHYTEIYVAAQNKDEILLQQALQHASINVLGCIPEVSPYKARVISSPVCQLAIEGNQDAVNFLLAKGASRGEAIYGYAIRGDQGQVDALLAQDKGAHRDHAIEGYALGKHIPQAEALAKDLDTGHQWLLLGYAKGGHFEQVNALLAGGLDPKWAIHGYAISGHMDQIDPLLEVGSIPDGLTVNYAMGGHVAKVNALLEQDSGLITEAIHGYAAVGNVAEVTYLLARGGKPIFAIFGFALGGRVDQVKALLAEGCDPAKLAKIAEGYAVGGHVNQVNDLLKQGLAPTDVIYGYALSGNTAQVEALLKRCQNFLQLDQAGYQAVYGYAHGGHRAGVNSLLERKVPQGKEAALKGYVAGGHTIYLDELAGVRLFEGIDNWLKELRKLGDHFMVAYANKLRARALKVFSGSDDEEPDEELDSEPPQLLESDEAKDAPEEKPGLVEEKPDRAALGVITDKNDSFRIGQAYAHDYAASNLHLLPNQEEFDWSAFTKDVQATYERHFQTEQNTQGSKVVTRVLYCDGAFANSDFKNKTIEAVAKAYLAAVKKYLKHFDRIDILALNPEVAAIFKNKLRSLSEEL